MKILFGAVLIIAFFISGGLHANQDSLQYKLDALAESEQIKFLLTEATAEYNTHPELSTQYKQMALEIATESGSDSLMCQTFLRLGNFFKAVGIQDSAAFYLDKSFAQCSKIGDSTALGSYYRITGNMLRGQGDYAGASESFYKAIRLFETQNEKIALAMTNNDMALLYNGGVNVNYVKALKYFNRAFSILQPFGDTNKLSVIYLNMAYAYYGLGIYDTALIFLKEDIKWNRKTKNNEMLILDLNVLSSVYQKQGNLEASLKTSKEALSLAKAFGNEPTTLRALLFASYLHLSLKQGKESNILTLEALALAKKLSAKSSVLTCYQYLDNGFSLIGDDEMAYKYLKLSGSLKDSILNAKKSKQIIELETKYETEKKDAKILLLKAEQKLADENLEKKRFQQIGLFIFIAILILFFGYILYTNKVKNRLKQKLQEIELHELRSKIKGLLENKPDALELTYESLNTKLNIPLSEREFEVLYLILQGLGNKQIADQLFISIHTVKFHLSNIYQKLGVNNRKEALQFVIAVA